MVSSTTTKMAASICKFFACVSHVSFDIAGVTSTVSRCLFFQRQRLRRLLVTSCVNARPITSFRRLQCSINPGEPQNVTEDEVEAIHDRLLRKVIPLYWMKMPYEDQLKMCIQKIAEKVERTTKCLKCLQQSPNKKLQPGLYTPLGEYLFTRDSDLPEFKYHEAAHALKTLARRLAAISPPDSPIMRQIQENGGMCCPLDPTKPSPVTEGYRNKSTFSINRGLDGNRKTVGMFAGTGRRYNIICVPADRCINMPESHLQVAQLYQQYIRSSPLPPCILFHHGGHWREITIRTNRAGDKMVIITFFPRGLSQEEIEAEKDKLVEFFIRGPGKICNISSLYFQASEKTRSTHLEAPFQLLHGEPYIYETCLGRQFRISPEAFFQTNTLGAEVLYQTIAEFSGVTPGATLLDICCGTGTIGIMLANSVEKVIGVEVVSQAVEDAKVNAVLNDVENAEFLCGKAEDVLPGLKPEVQDTPELLAVVDPPRGGLHAKVTRAIRNCLPLKRLVYVSCKPRGETMRNFIELCRPPTQKMQGPPFVPVRAVPVDLFPHTSHIELIILFERQEAETV